MIRLVPVKPEQKNMLWNINQKYLYEMTAFYPDEMDADGNLHYGHFDEYFIDPKRKAFFLYNDDVMIGFAMLNPYSAMEDHQPDYTMAEFTVFPSYRKNHYAFEAAKLILSTYIGKWEVKFNEKNAPAKKLWVKVAAPYSPEVYHLNEEETILAFHNEIS